MKKFFKDMDLIIVTDKEGKVLYYNNFNDIYNTLGNEYIIGKSIFELYPWLTKENSTIFKVIETGEPIVNQTQTIKVNDEFVVNAINSAFPLKDENGILGAIEISISLDSDNRNDGKDKKSRLKGLLSSLNAKYSFDDIVTKNSRMLSIINELKKVAPNDSNVFICGETGTGKELFAHSIHNLSKRYDKPFIAQNCAAIPETLIESIFFGTTSGSFTGAQDKQGIFEMANGGTIFLDEINSMPLEMQAKLLRVIEEKTIRRIGDDKDVYVDVRIITSTNEDPRSLIKNNRLRTDLYYRLNVVMVELLPLRERKEDIEVLCEYFISHFNSIFKKKIKGIDDSVKSIFLNYDWPGNVRELKNCIESAFNTVSGSLIRVNNIPQYIVNLVTKQGKNQAAKNMKLNDLVESYEKELIKDALLNNRMNIAKTARAIGIPRQTLYYKLRKYKIIEELETE
jgi:arginine utilization regulatory protein